MPNNAAKANHQYERPNDAPQIDTTGSRVTVKDEELVNRARNDDQWAAGELIRRYQQKAYTIAYQMSSGDSDEALDLTQEALLKAFRNLKNFRGKSSFYTWFYRIVVNTCLDWRRRNSRKEWFFPRWRSKHREDQDSRQNEIEEHPDMAEHKDPLSVLSGKQMQAKIRATLESLPKNQRTAFQLKVLQGMNIREIAQIMGSAEGTVKSHLFRATRVVRGALKEWAGP